MTTVDAQGHRQTGPGGDGGVDPADQWVLNPETGTYELRLDAGEMTYPAPNPPNAVEAPVPYAAEAVRTSPSTEAAAAPGGRRAARGGSGSGGRRRPRAKAAKTPKPLVWAAGALGLVLVAGGILRWRGGWRQV
jgi:hypothetical protein